MGGAELLDGEVRPAVSWRYQANSKLTGGLHMNFNQTIGVLVVTLVIGGMGWLARTDREAFRKVTPAVLVILSAAGALGFAYMTGFSSGASDQWQLDFHESIARTDAAEKSVNSQLQNILQMSVLTEGEKRAISTVIIPSSDMKVRDTPSPIPGWIWMLLLLTYVGISVLAIVEPILKRHATAEAAAEANSNAAQRHKAD